MPHLARHVDDIAVIRSLYTTNLTHEPSVYMIQSGKMGPGRPVLGSWVTYGLGSVNQNLPAYVVLDDPDPPVLLKEPERLGDGLLRPEPRAEASSL